LSIPKYFLSPFDLPEEPVHEYRFHPVRKWRIDVAFPKHRLAIEIEGAVWCQGRHTRGSGFIADMCKYNELTLMGWSLLRFTPKQVKNGEAITTIHRWFNDRKGR
jgi:very-short-patch-repair endonuclease